MIINKIETAQINNYANNLGIAIKYAPDVQRLDKLKEAANAYRVPTHGDLGELLFNADPAEWDQIVCNWSATYDLPTTMIVRQKLVDERITPALNDALKADRGNIIKQAYPSAEKAAKTLTLAVEKGIRSLTNYEQPAHDGTTQYLIDAQRAVDVLHAYAKLIAYIADLREDGNRTNTLAAVIAPPATLKARAVNVKYAAGADPRWTQPGIVSVADPADERIWKAAIALLSAPERERIFDTAIDAYPGGFTVSPVKSLDELSARADHYETAARNNVLNAAQRSDLSV
ncbi:hypothetical protein [Tsukamurella strandjordii]|uniref:Uncharacterized protein n=1 Tax=Tsukamurella strandjordii TaxID=147577 RepID=A0AA90NQA2_9ACTN|nr:hypothetical protein [Tsukamurella strandjordii]MDP0398704.1 hypothetical protein [Tsukamurella strandjordii]